MLNRKRLFIVGLIIGIMIVSLCACSNNSSEVVDDGQNAKTHESNAGESSEDKDKSLTIAVRGVTNSLDYTKEKINNLLMVYNHTSNALVKMDKDLIVVPDIATEWKRTDGVHWEFKIGKGYKFHNGDDLKLSDIVFTVERIKGILEMSKLGDVIEKVEASGEDTIKITTNKEVDILRDLATVYIVSERAVKEAGDKLPLSIVGTGPYKFESFVQGDKIVLTRWDDYPFDKPAIKTLTFKNILDGAGRYIALETGEADIALELEDNDMQRLADNNDLEKITYDGTTVYFFTLNTKSGPMSDIKVRTAVAHAIDREGLMTITGNPSIANSIVPSPIEGHVNNYAYPERSIEKAKALLKEAGYENGLDIEYLSYVNNDPRAQLVQANLKEAGINMKITTLEFGVFLEKQKAGEYDICSVRWGPTPEDIINSVCTYSYSDNISFYDNPKVAKLIDEARYTMDHDVKLQKCDEIQKIVAKDIPLLPVYYPLERVGVNKKVVGADIRKSGKHIFYNADIK